MGSTDVLLVGYNSGDFDEYVATTRASGPRQAAYRDVRLAALWLDGHERTAMDLLNLYGPQSGHVRSNADFLWPAITYLGSYLQRAGFRWDYVNLFREQHDLLAEKLRTDDVRVVAITTTVYVSPQPILEVVALVRRLSPGTLIVVGGPYLSDKPSTMRPDDLDGLLTMLGADFYVFSSEGEAALVHLLGSLRTGDRLDDVPNLAYRDGDRWRRTPLETERNSLADNPVDYSLFRPADLTQFVSIRTAKSCPFKCSFCGFPGRAGKYTYLDVDLVERELDAIAELDTVSTLTVIDDTFNVPKARFKEILRMMIRNKYGFRWNSYLRSDHVDDEALELMAESGCEGVFLGVESGSADQLKNMNKSSRPHHYRYVLERCRQLDIITYASLIVGFPGETEETLRETLEFLAEARPDFYRAQCWYADPFTPVFKDLDRHRIVGQGFRWSHRTMDSQEASGWVDHFFQTVDASCWLPQNGFELWSVFYLRRHGMPLDRIKSYLAAWGDAVRYQMLHGERTDLPIELRDPLIGQATYHRPAPEPLARRPYGPTQVRAGVRHWLGTLRGPEAWAAPDDPTWHVAPEPLPERAGQPLTDMAAATATVSGRLLGTEEVLLLVGELDHPAASPATPVPLAVAGVGLADPRALADDISRSLDAARRHAHTADAAVLFALDRGAAALPGCAVVSTAEPDLAAALVRLEDLCERPVATRLQVAVVGLPDGSWHLAHRGLPTVVGSDFLPGGGEPALADVKSGAVPTFDL